MTNKEGRAEDAMSLASSMPALKALIEEAAQHVIVNQGKHGACPQGWIQTIRNVIDDMEMENLQSRLQNPVELAMTTETPSPERTGTASSDNLCELSSHNERKVAFEDTSVALNELQGEIQTVLSVIDIHLAHFASLDKNGAMISDLAYLSVLRTEYAILTNLANQVTDIYGAPGGMGGEVAEAEDALQQEIDVLLLQLEAIFNTKCREVELKSIEIDDRGLMQMSIECQRRTEIIRNIDRLLKEKRRIRRETESRR